MDIRLAFAAAALLTSVLCVAADAADSTAPAPASSTTASSATPNDNGGVKVQGVQDPWTQSDERMRRLEKGLPCVGCDATNAHPDKLPWYLEAIKAGFQPPPPQSDADQLRNQIVTEQAHPSNLTP